jgi:PAS domain S-box-containing protein
MTDAVERAQELARALGMLFVETAVPTIALEPDGRFRAANAATIRQYGWSLEELLGMRIHDFIADDRSIEADLERAHKGGGALFDRRPHRRKDGSILWVAPSPGPVEIGGERLIVSVLRDVTPIVEAERDRQLLLGVVVAMMGEPSPASALKALARAFADAMEAEASVWLPVKEGSRVLGRVAGSAEHEDARVDLDAEAFAGLAWETRIAQRVARDGTADGSFERRLVDQFGPHVFVTPLVGRGEPRGLMYGHGKRSKDFGRALALATTLGGFGGMILDAARLEAAAKRDAERAEVVWQAASERLSDGVMLLDEDLRVIRVNSAECALLGGLGLGGKDIMGRRCRDILPLCRGIDPCPHEVAMTERLRLVREFVSTITHRPMRIEIIPALPNDAKIGVIHVARDLSEERAMRTRLVAADRLATIGRLAAGVAHEINNPAAFVTVNLGVLKERFEAGTASAPEALAILDESLNGMHRIREIVRDLKGLARERSRDRVDLSQVALTAIRMSTHETRGRARVERTLGENVLAEVRGARIAQVILNLIVNAAQAFPQGNPQDHCIRVRTYRDRDRTRVEVADTGPGVPPDLRSRIFEPFFTTREATGGTGLGLWLSRGIVEEEGGTLDVRDGTEGGACFVIDLPAAAPSAPHRVTE